MKTLVLYSAYLGTRKASYYDDWLDAFLDFKAFEITTANIVPPWLKTVNPSKYRNPEGVLLSRRVTPYRFLYEAYARAYKPLLSAYIQSRPIGRRSEIGRYDLIILLHSTNADSMLALTMLEGVLKNRKGKLVMFVGNEYCLMPEKIGFLNRVEADFVVCQLPEKAANWLYSDSRAGRVLCIPHGFNEKAYRPHTRTCERKIDIGFIGDRYSFAIGDTERTDIAHFFVNAEFGLRTDIRIGEKLRIPRDRYVRFLNSVRATLGAESGTYYLEKTDETYKRVEAFLSLRPQATFEEVYERFFKGYKNPVSGKTISSRHFEPIGTKTCQVLLEGDYSGILKPNEHYIPLRKDYSNANEVLERLRDDSYVQRMVDDTYEFAMEGHTYRHRVRELWKAVTEDDRKARDSRG